MFALVMAASLAAELRDAEVPDTDKDARVIGVDLRSNHLREVHWFYPVRGEREGEKGWLYRVTVTKKLQSSSPPYTPITTVMEGYFFLQDSSIIVSQLTRGPWSTQTLCKLLGKPDPGDPVKTGKQLRELRGRKQ